MYKTMNIPQASIKRAAEVEAELRTELEGEASRRREGEERGEREQSRLRSELKSKETAYKEHQGSNSIDILGRSLNLSPIMFGDLCLKTLFPSTELGSKL